MQPVNSSTNDAIVINILFIQTAKMHEIPWEGYKKEKKVL